jgi:two-component system cell cycle sensor histidine kinase/response regulator CckA
MNQIVELPVIRRLRDMSATLHLLILERSESEANLNLHELQRAGFRCESRTVGSQAEFVEQLRFFPYEVVLANYDLQDWSGKEALEILRQSGKNVPFIFVTDPLGEKTAVECFRCGASDYVLKQHRAQLPEVVERALRTKSLQDARTLMIQALRLSEASSHLLFSQNPLPMWVIDIETLEFLEMNQAALNHYGFERHEFLQMRLSDLHPAEEIPRLLAAAHEGPGNTQNSEKWRHAVKDHSTIDVEMHFQRLEYAGRPATMVVAQDFTRRRMLEEQLQQMQKFEAIGELAGGVAHDFSNVIGAILGWAEMGEEQAEPIHPRLALYFKKIHGQCDRVNALIKRLLALSRRQILEPRDLDLNHRVRDVVGFLGKVIGSEVEIKTALANDLRMVHADPAQVEQVLVNLCINAREAMPGGGTLRIETANISCSAVDCRKDPLLEIGDYSTVSVTDTGIGMDAHVRRRIFEPFFSTKNGGHGTGLGLATVYGIVNQHGGLIQVESSPNRGSTFRIFFPVRGQTESAVSQPAVAQPRVIKGGSETILIAEGHEGMRDMARSLLESIGHTVLLATDGKEAIEIFSARRDSIDLVVLNVTMPRCGGAEAYTAIKQLKATVPVLFSSASCDEKSAVSELHKFGVQIIQKPYSPAVLCRKIREALDHPRSAAAHTN